MYVFSILILAIIITAIYWYNKTIGLEKNIEKSESGIDVYLQQRFDLIPNLVEATKGYAKYEKGLLEKIAELRASYSNHQDLETRNKLNEQYNRIVMVVEKYPELKSSEQFLKLQKTLIKIESQLQAARRIYNNDVTKYNTKINSFPGNMFLIVFNFKEHELFSLDGEDKVTINF